MRLDQQMAEIRRQLRNLPPEARGEVERSAGKVLDILDTEQLTVTPDLLRGFALGACSMAQEGARDLSTILGLEDSLLHPALARIVRAVVMADLLTSGVGELDPGQFTDEVPS